MKQFAKIALATGMMAIASLSFAANQSTSVSPAERAKIETVVHDYLLKNPEIMVEVMQLLQKKQYDQAQQTVKQTQQIASTFAKSLFHETNDPVAGNPNGAVTIVEFFDYQCPHCVDMAPVMAAIIKANPNVRVVYKEFPIRGPLSEFAARAALAANKQGKYEIFSGALLTPGVQLTQDSILDIAKKNGLNVDQLKKDMNDSSIKSQVNKTVKLAQDLKLFGTPALFIGKTDAQGKDAINYVPGQTDQAKLQQMVDAIK